MVVKYPQPEHVVAFKKNHASNRQKFFYIKNAHDLHETNSASGFLAFPLLKRRAMRETTVFPGSEPKPI